MAAKTQKFYTIITPLVLNWELLFVLTVKFVTIINAIIYVLISNVQTDIIAKVDAVIYDQGDVNQKAIVFQMKFAIIMFAE